MSGTDYVLGLLAIVSGLAISDMVVSLHGLLINRRNVAWDWLCLIAALFVLLLIVGAWRISFVAFQGISAGPPIWVFLVVLLQTACLYLAARAALPDRVEIGQKVDLAAHYGFVDRYLWSTIAFFYASFAMLNGLGHFLLGRVQFPDLVLQSLIALPLIVALAIWPTRRLHRIVVPILLIWLCFRLLPGRLLAL